MSINSAGLCSDRWSFVPGIDELFAGVGIIGLCARPSGSHKAGIGPVKVTERGQMTLLSWNTSIVFLAERSSV